MARYRLSPSAERDIEAILTWTQLEFGEQVRLRYETLLVQSIRDLANDPCRAGTTKRPELAEGAWTYHLRHSRDRVRPLANRIRRPRHFLLFRVAKDGCIEIARVLHDSMDLIRHLPEDLGSVESADR